jgi:hypothetical protein
VFLCFFWCFGIFWEGKEIRKQRKSKDARVIDVRPAGRSQSEANKGKVRDARVRDARPAGRSQSEANKKEKKTSVR